MRRVPGCSGKLKFASRELAAKVTAAPQNVARGEPRRAQYAYQCASCKCWHTSSQPEAVALVNKARSIRQAEHNRVLVAKLLVERGIAPRTKVQ